MPDCAACCAQSAAACASCTSGTAMMSNGTTNASITAPPIAAGISPRACPGQRRVRRRYHGHSATAKIAAQPSAGRKSRSVRSPAKNSTVAAIRLARICDRDIATPSSSTQVPGGDTSVRSSDTWSPLLIAHTVPSATAHGKRAR